MRIYASTFTSGLKDVVRAIFEKTFPGVQVLRLLDGLIIYQGNFPLDAVQKLRFINNSFIVIRQFDHLEGNAVNQMLNEISNDRQLKTLISSRCKLSKGQTTFRVVVSDQNQSVSIQPRMRTKIEETIAASTSLSVNRTKPNTEFWILNRSEGVGFFLQRLTSHTAYENLLEQGQLKPEICYMLCFLSEPNADDIFLDPFCGYGSIPLERAVSFPYNMIYAIDQDPEKRTFLRSKLKKIRLKQPLIVKTQNALQLDSFEDNFIHKIVTDPPWGLYEKAPVDNLEEFYSQMLKELLRVLRPGGIMVLLTAGKSEMEQALVAFEENIQRLAKFDVLISGKKAAIYQLKKIR